MRRQWLDREQLLDARLARLGIVVARAQNVTLNGRPVGEEYFRVVADPDKPADQPQARRQTSWQEQLASVVLWNQLFGGRDLRLERQQRGENVAET